MEYKQHKELKKNSMLKVLRRMKECLMFEINQYLRSYTVEEKKLSFACFLPLFKNVTLASKI